MNALPFISLGMVLAVAAAGDNAAAELKKLDGAWAMERLEFNGMDVTEKYKVDIAIKGGVITIAGQKKVERDYGKIAFKIDPRTKPRVIDFTVAAGDKKGTTLEGIYELKDGKLTICIQAFGTDRPGEFKSADGSNIALVVFARKKQ